MVHQIVQRGLDKILLQRQKGLDIRGPCHFLASVLVNFGAGQVEGADLQGDIVQGIELGADLAGRLLQMIHDGIVHDRLLWLRYRIDQ